MEVFAGKVVAQPEEDYWLLGFADKEYDTENCLLLQRAFVFDEQKNSNASQVSSSITGRRHRRMAGSKPTKASQSKLSGAEASMTSRRQFEAMLARTLQQALAPLGFQQVRKEFVADFGETFAMASLQSDKHNDDRAGRYVVNYAGGSRRFFLARPAGWSEFKPSFGMFPFQARTGAFSGRDVWLSVRYESDPMELEKDVLVFVALVADEATRLAAIFRDDQAICDWFGKADCFGITDFARERVVEALGCQRPGEGGR